MQAMRHVVPVVLFYIHSSCIDAEGFECCNVDFVSR